MRLLLATLAVVLTTVMATEAESRDACTLPPAPGPCRASFPRWYYHSENGTCKEFVFGGCQGNGNNFETDAACKRLCGGIECSLPKCDKHCEFGYKKDAAGCQTCGCQEDNQCPDFPCELDCEHGYRINEDGCKLCQCNEPQPRPTCPPYRCMMYCEHGFVIDENGCEMCKCRLTPGPTRPPTPEPSPSVCPAVSCAMFCEEGFAKDNNGCETCRCQNQPCPAMHCALGCPFGFQFDRFNCQTCQCRSNPCHVVDCADGMVCRVEEVQCVRAPCYPMAQCVKLPPVVAEACTLPMVPGPCEAYMPRWYFHSESRTCKAFVFGGCAANGNNFESEAACKRVCGALECPAVRCRMFCRDGFERDAAGCQLCSCKPPPPPPPPPTTARPCPPVVCQMACEGGFRRGSDGCEVCECSPPCPRLNCRLACEHGWATDDAGCRVCKCASTTTTTPMTTTTTTTRRPPAPCDDVMCDMFCRYGFERDEAGCEICRCRSALRTTPQPPHPKCPLLGCQLFCERGHMKDSKGCPTCRCQGVICPQVLCASRCPFGYKRDSLGCQTCNCAQDPCQDVVCDKGQECHSKLTECLVQPCLYQTLCIAETAVCKLPADTGKCRAYFKRWYFSTQHGRCEKFIFGGCGGNANNFETEAACKAVCHSDKEYQHKFTITHEAKLPIVDVSSFENELRRQLSQWMSDGDDVIRVLNITTHFDGSNIDVTFRLSDHIHWMAALSRLSRNMRKDNCVFYFRGATFAANVGSENWDVVEEEEEEEEEDGSSFSRRDVILTASMVALVCMLSIIAIAAVCVCTKIKRGRSMDLTNQDLNFHNIVYGGLSPVISAPSVEEQPEKILPTAPSKASV